MDLDSSELDLVGYQSEETIYGSSKKRTTPSEAQPKDASLSLRPSPHVSPSRRETLSPSRQEPETLSPAPHQDIPSPPRQNTPSSSALSPPPPPSQTPQSSTPPSPPLPPPSSPCNPEAEPEGDINDEELEDDTSQAKKPSKGKSKGKGPGVGKRKSGRKTNKKDVPPPGSGKVGKEKVVKKKPVESKPVPPDRTIIHNLQGQVCNHRFSGNALFDTSFFISPGCGEVRAIVSETIKGRHLTNNLKLSEILFMQLIKGFNIALFTADKTVPPHLHLFRCPKSSVRQ